ncbi:hypothetical protein VP01_3214g1 [Puccinia sorghi]|uniref:Uncharacterized protein n=1 Tax=Puccinia sorghi TaxID=27349 RepID=A0A0L6UY96_9BASI|nr:hypothetical protein VP01_3214g1 [Puccinia sorghi]
MMSTTSPWKRRKKINQSIEIPERDGEDSEEADSDVPPAAVNSTPQQLSLQIKSGFASKSPLSILWCFKFVWAQTQVPLGAVPCGLGLVPRRLDQPNCPGFKSFWPIWKLPLPPLLRLYYISQRSWTNHFFFLLDKVFIVKWTSYLEPEPHSDPGRWVPPTPLAPKLAHEGTGMHFWLLEGGSNFKALPKFFEKHINIFDWHCPSTLDCFFFWLSLSVWPNKLETPYTPEALVDRLCLQANIILPKSIPHCKKKLAQLPAFDMQKVPGSFCFYSNHAPKVFQPSFDAQSLQTCGVSMEAWLEHAACQLHAVDQVFFSV